MFGLVESVLVPCPLFWERARAFLRGETGVQVSEERVWGVLFARVRIELLCGENAEKNRRRVAYALEGIARRGVSGVVLPSGFVYDDLLGAYGLVAASPVPLYRRLAGRLAVYAADALCVEASRLRVTLIAKRVSHEVATAADALCARARYLALSIDRGGDALCQNLRRTRGVAVLENPTEEQMGETDVFVVFDGWDESRVIPARPGAAVLLLGGGRFRIPPGCLVADGARLSPPCRMQKEWPWDADNEALITALLGAGAVALPEIQILGLTCQGSRI